MGRRDHDLEFAALDQLAVCSVCRQVRVAEVCRHCAAIVCRLCLRLLNVLSSHWYCRGDK